RLIVTSAAYRQSSAVPDAIGKADPENRWLGRMSRKRMTFEGLRDGLLATAGRLDPAVGGKSVDLFKEPFATRRALYGFIDRHNLPATLPSFHMPFPHTHPPPPSTPT